MFNKKAEKFPWQKEREKHREGNWNYAAKMGYYKTKEWRIGIREPYLLNKSYKCEACLKLNGKSKTFSSRDLVLDHIEPVPDNISFYDFLNVYSLNDNLMSLCTYHHRQKTGNPYKFKNSLDGEDLRRSFEE